MRHRAYILKTDGSWRPLGIPTFEDKVAQRAIVMVLETVYEQDFLPCYLETESELSCGSPDFDLITEVSDAVCEPGCGFGRVATGEVFGAEVLVVSAVA